MFGNSNSFDLWRRQEQNRENFPFRSTKRVSMKRRDFLKTSLMVAALGSVLGKATGVLNNALAAVVMVKPGTLGYKDPAPANQVKAGKQCKTCNWFKADASAGAGHGLCTLPAMKSAAKAPSAPAVAELAYCNMWKKKA